MIVSENFEISVVIGLVSTEDGDRILETLAALEARQGERRCEVVLADRRQDAISAEIAQRHPAVRLIPCPADMTLPEMRAIAMEASSAEIVAVTEDHCVPTENWLSEILAPFDDPTVTAAGGCVENGVHDNGFDWATFLCEYSFFSPPVAEGDATVLPGMNVAYRRSALAAVGREALVKGFWETTVHPRLLAAGGRLVSRNAIKMRHCKKFSFGLFMSQRFIYSRYFAGIRFPRTQVARRLIATLASLALPPLLLLRMTRSAFRKSLGREFVRALPALVVLVVVWSIGEMAGYLAGPGDALARIE